jgi:hypothetical protein
VRSRWIVVRFVPLSHYRIIRISVSFAVFDFKNRFRCRCEGRRSLLMGR